MSENLPDSSIPSFLWTLSPSSQCSPNSLILFKTLFFTCARSCLMQRICNVVTVLSFAFNSLVFNWCTSVKSLFCCRKKMKLFSESHKTVFVVDHCPYMAESCRQHVEFDMLVKNRTQGIIPLAPISRSLWTCSVESSMEYCRIMYDIFPFKKLVSIPYLL